MILRRISNYADLSGTGAVLHAGRWHHRGHPVVHLVESPAGALPRHYQLLEVQVPGGAAAETAALATGPGWREDVALTRNLGSQWLAANRSLLLKVPSVVVARSHHHLFNPLHPAAAQCRVVSVSHHPFDGRLLPPH